MSESWVVQNIQNALNIWNQKLYEVWQLLTVSPESFRGGTIWNVVESLFGSIQAVAYALLVLFFVSGLVKTCTSFDEVKRPSVALKLFLRFIIAKGLITYSLDLVNAIMSIFRGICNEIFKGYQLSGVPIATLPQSMIEAIESCGEIEKIPLWIVSFIGCVFVWVVSITMILNVYGRFFKIYLFAAVAPLPLSTFASESTQNYGKTFLKGFVGVCFEGVIIMLCCILFSVFSSSEPIIDSSQSIITQVWCYLGEILLNMLILVGSIKMSDKLVKDMIG